MIVTLINIDSGMLTQTNLLLVLQLLDSYYSYMVSVCSTQFRCVQLIIFMVSQQLELTGNFVWQITQSGK